MSVKNMLAWTQLFPWFMWQVQQEFHNSGFMADVDLDPGCTLNKKIRNAQLAQYNFILGQFQHTLSLLCLPVSLFIFGISSSLSI